MRCSSLLLYITVASFANALSGKSDKESDKEVSMKDKALQLAKDNKFAIGAGLLAAGAAYYTIRTRNKAKGARKNSNRDDDDDGAPPRRRRIRRKK